MNVLDLFSGIGGFSLGLERAGMRTVAFCEIDPYCRKILAKHWPSVPIHEDVTKLRGADVGPVDVICGGFPCQDISLAGKGAGLAGERSGLWRDYARLIGELRPKFVIVENVSALLSRGLDDVLGDLASLGYDAEWHCIPASALGAHHRRDRLWIVAYADCRWRRPDATGGHDPDRADAGWTEANRLSGTGSYPGRAQDLAYAYSIDAEGQQPWSDDPLIWREQIERSARLCSGTGSNGPWEIEPELGRVAHGVSNRMDRLGSLGNAVVPQIPEAIGRAIMSTKREL